MIILVILPDPIPIPAADGGLLTVYVKGHRFAVPHAGNGRIGRIVLAVNLGQGQDTGDFKDPTPHGVPARVLHLDDRADRGIGPILLHVAVDVGEPRSVLHRWTDAKDDGRSRTNPCRRGHGLPGWTAVGLERNNRK